MYQEEKALDPRQTYWLLNEDTVSMIYHLGLNQPFTANWQSIPWGKIPHGIVLVPEVEIDSSALWARGVNKINRHILKEREAAYTEYTDESALKYSHVPGASR